MRHVVLVIILLVLGPGSAVADGAYAPVAEVIPATVTSYPTSADAALGAVFTDIGGLSGAASAPLALRKPSTPARGGAPTLRFGSESSSGVNYLPVLLSALVPGAGEIYMGYWKLGALFVAAEAGAWTGYFYKHNQGLDTREEYEAFADAHWNIERFAFNHIYTYNLTFDSFDEAWNEMVSQGIAASGSQAWPGYSPWVSKEEDKQHYYENIGKYDWYVSGWNDYVPGTRETDIDPLAGEVLSQRREEYRELRQESNDQLDTATRYIYISIAARVVSIVQTTLLLRRTAAEETASAENHWMLRARSRGAAAGEVALEYWFK